MAIASRSHVARWHRKRPRKGTRTFLGHSKAAEQLACGEVRDIALGLATPLEQPEKARYFLSVAGAGPDGRITYAVDLELKARRASWLIGGKARAKFSTISFIISASASKDNRAKFPW